jgi:hypothetical protein
VNFFFSTCSSDRPLFFPILIVMSFFTRIKSSGAKGARMDSGAVAIRSGGSLWVLGQTDLVIEDEATGQMG